MFRTVIAATFILATAFAPAADEKPRPGIDQIMVQVHLKPQNRGTRNNLDNKVIDGKASADEQKQLLELYQLLASTKPPKGDLDAWKKRTNEMVDAVQAVIRGEAKAAERLTKARDCKACHTLNRKVD
jgi:hypothetical protein